MTATQARFLLLATTVVVQLSCTLGSAATVSAGHVHPGGAPRVESRSATDASLDSPAVRVSSRRVRLAGVNGVALVSEVPRVDCTRDVCSPEEAMERTSWLPTDSEVARFEAGFPAFLNRSISRHIVDSALAGRLSSYRRQYMGFTEAGVRILYVQFLCREMPDWETTPVFVSEGGDCFVDARFEIDSGVYRSLIVHRDL